MVTMSRSEERKAFERRRRGRNLALLAALAAIVVLLYALPFVRMGGP
jgi:ferric-dicitrate binding protein FerR (iron transport regulator)